MSDVIEPMQVPPVEASASSPAEASAPSPAEASAPSPVEASASSPVEVSASPPVTAENTPEAPASTLAPTAVDDQACTDPLATPRASSEAEIRKPRGRPFEPGRSGNPNGRPKGSRNRIARAVQELIDGQAEALGAKAIEKALEGDSNMLRALLSRIVPAQRARTVELELPNIETAAEARAASTAVLAACTRGEISPAEASEILALIATLVRIIEATDLEARQVAVEAKQQKLTAA
jgi:hypothetical protein